jgi:type II secretory pathway pseudopilin PulG
MTRRRAFSLIEAIAAIVVLSIAVPSTMAVLVDSSRANADAVNTTRASALASLVLEQVLADASSESPALGFAAFADANAYLTTATTGLNDRIAASVAPYQAVGMTYLVTIGDLADNTGAVTGNPALDLFRLVTVTVTFPTSRGSSNLNAAVLVADLS